MVGTAQAREVGFPALPDGDAAEYLAGTSPELRHPRGDADAEADAGDLLPVVYQSLKELARQRMSLERPGHTLQATALVHEAFLRLTGAKGVRFAGRVQFFHAAAQAMRRILVEHARARGRVKRGAGARRVPINILDLAEEADREEILALEEAVRRLEEHTPEIAAVVRLRFFAGLSVAETAEALLMGRRSVDRAWSYARVWLYRELYEGDGRDAAAPPLPREL